MSSPSPARAPASDRNLLFGILALQNDFVSRDQLVEAMNAWVLAKHRSLGDLLRERGALGAGEFGLIEALVNRQLARHGGDVEKSLLSLSSVTDVRSALAAVADADMQASLKMLSAGRAKRDADDTPPPDTRPPGMSAESGSGGLRYRVLRPHARGGLGEVFVAEDIELHREVALKEIQLRHADDASSRGRFVLEAEITGGLEHPGIVPVYGLGTYLDGRPFYAMRFIRGDNLKHAIARFHCQSRERQRPNESNPAAHAPSSAKFDSLEFRRLLGRFLDVCNAVAYAHSRGVLHRDLKPGNIMLGQFGETLLVDWGLAKILAKDDEPRASDGKESLPQEKPLRPLSSSSLVETIAGTAVGTPAYMSPEQAEGRLDQLGPATDVYSLGATLYCLLTGRSPVQEGEPAEVLERVRRGDIPAPATVRPGVPPALAAICRKAMALHPADRYPTALALAADVEHWLADEPVSACAEPLVFKARRWARKHPRSVTGLAATVLVGVIGLSAGLFFVNAEKDRTELARQGEETQRIEAQTQAELARNNEKAAKEREAETEAVLDFVENKVFAAARPKNQEGGMGYDVKLADAVKEALSFVEKSFPDQPLIEARLRLTLGNSFLYLGKPKIAAEQDERARALYTKHRGPDHPDTLKSMNNLAGSYSALGRYVDALKLNEETLELRKAKLGPDHSDTLKSMYNVAIGYDDLNRHADALKLKRETLALAKTTLGPDDPQTLRVMNSIAVSYRLLGRYTDALELDQQTLRLRRIKLGPDHLDTLKSMSNLAGNYNALGRHGDALKLMEEIVPCMKAKVGPDHPDTLRSMDNLAYSYGANGRHADALKLRQETLALSKDNLGTDHPVTLLITANLAESLVMLDRGGEAVVIIDDCTKRAAGKVVNPRLIPFLMDLRLRAFEKTKDAAGCRSTAEKWENLNRTDAESLYTAACMRSVTATVLRAYDKSEKAVNDANTEADQAIAWLTKAVAAGYKDADHMKKDKDLDALRDRPDFQKLLTELEAKAKHKETKPAQPEK